MKLKRPEQNRQTRGNGVPVTEEDKEPAHMPWFLYPIEFHDESIYTGIAKDVAARYAEHLCGKGARYTRAHPPTRLLASKAYPDQSSALKAEYQIKQLKPEAKRRVVREILAKVAESMLS